MQLKDLRWVDLDKRKHSQALLRPDGKLARMWWLNLSIGVLKDGYCYSLCLSPREDGHPNGKWKHTYGLDAVEAACLIADHADHPDQRPL
jgi:hypothetical protein